MSYLLRLPTEIFRMVIDLLDPKSIASLRLTCRRCRAQVEPVFCRTLTLHDDIGPEYPSETVSRLLDPEDGLSGMVRHLVIGPFSKLVHCPKVDEVIQILKTLPDLREFSWHSRFPIPPPVLRYLHFLWPSARLHARSVVRKVDDIDVGLLSSPQLYSLEFTLNPALFIHYSDVARGRNREAQLDILKQCLVQGANLKKLHFKRPLYFKPVVQNSTWIQLPFKEGDRFPALEALRISYDRFDFNQEYCALWTHCQDFSRLRHLDLEKDFAPELLRSLVGKIPNLVSLRTGLMDVSIGRYSNSSLVFHLIASIRGLARLTLAYCTKENLDLHWADLWEHHKHSLNILQLESPSTDLGNRSAEDMQTLWPGIEDIPRFEKGRGLPDIPYEYFAV